MNKTKRYVNIMIEILLVFSIILAVFAIFIKGVVLNKNTYTYLFNNNGTYNQVKETIYDKMDKMLGAKSLSNDIKESIISEEDIKREADNTIAGVIQYLSTGENNMAPIDTEIYKERIREILSTIMGDVVNSTSSDLTFNDTIEPKNTASIEGELQFDNVSSNEKKVQVNNMVLIKDTSKTGQESISKQNLSTTSEAKAKIQEILNEKGLTVAEARQKMVEKGITEEQAIQMLKGYGITVDENEVKASVSGNAGNVQGSTSENSLGNQISGTANNGAIEASGNISGNGNTESSESALSGDIKNEIISELITNDGKSTEEKLKNIENKVSDKAGKIIDNEIQKINLDKLIESNMAQKLAKITAFFSKMFWLIMILPIMLILILIKVNEGNVYSSLKYLGSAFLIAGIVIFGTFYGGYISQVYEKINISINTVYFKDIFTTTIKHLLIILSTAGVVTFVLGVISFIPAIKNNVMSKFTKE